MSTSRQWRKCLYVNKVGSVGPLRVDSAIPKVTVVIRRKKGKKITICDTKRVTGYRILKKVYIHDVFSSHGYK